MVRRILWFIVLSSLFAGLLVPYLSRPAAALSSPSVTLSPATGPSGTLVQVSGTVYRRFRGATVQVVWDSTSTLVTLPVNGGSSSFAGQFVVPATSTGVHTVTTISGGVTQAQTDFSVMSPSPSATPTSPPASPTYTSTSIPTSTPTTVITSTATPVSTASGTAKGVLEPRGSLFGAEANAGFRYFRLEVIWDRAEPANGTYDESYFQTLRDTITAARAAGLTPVLSFGLEYPPSWVFSLDSAGSRLQDQYGDVWTGGGPGEHVANGVFSSAIRNAMAPYMAHVFQDLGTSWGGVNWGGGLVYDEVRYPWCPTGRTNCYWAFDANARAQNPVPSYVPGTGDPSLAQTFVDWYNRSLQNYIVWGMKVIRQSYVGNINVLLPSWGVRPGDISNAVSVNLNGSVYRSNEVAGGLDWADQLPAYVANGQVTADCTWANRLDDPWNDPQDWSPVHYLASILPPGMLLGGENSAGAAAVTDMNDTFNNARAFHLQWIMWMNEAATQIAGNATLEQIGAQ